MSRRAWLASACLVSGLLAVSTPAWADDPTTPTPTPTATSTGLPLPILPTPTPTAAAAAPVTGLSATVDGTGAVDAAWRTGSGDRSFTATAIGGGRTLRVETGTTSASFPAMPAATLVTVTVTAHGAGADSAAVTATVRTPAAVPTVTGARMRSVASGLVVSWTTSAAAGARYLVELTDDAGGHSSRLVSGSSVTLTGLTSGRLYSATVTTVTDTGRSAPAIVPPAVWTPPASDGPALAPQQAPVGAGATSAPSAAATDAAAPEPAAQRTLVSSPLAAAGLAALAVVLGGLAIGLLLRRPRDRRP